jgi:hypothetical protein
MTSPPLISAMPSPVIARYPVGNGTLDQARAARSIEHGLIQVKSSVGIGRKRGAPARSIAL